MNAPAPKPIEETCPQCRQKYTPQPKHDSSICPECIESLKNDAHG